MGTIGNKRPQGSVRKDRDQDSFGLYDLVLFIALVGLVVGMFFAKKG